MPDSENSCTSGQMSLWGMEEKLLIISETLPLPGSLIEENSGWKGTKQWWEEVRWHKKMKDETDQLQ